MDSFADNVDFLLEHQSLTINWPPLEVRFTGYGDNLILMVVLLVMMHPRKPRGIFLFACSSFPKRKLLGI